jgi:spore germination cell wall hydrolase CwlJ-like protein
MYRNGFRSMALATAMLFSLAAVYQVTQIKLRHLRVALDDRAEIVTVHDRERQLKCMADNIYYEAAMEPAEGKLAVAQIVMNRSESPDFPKDICQVIYQRNSFYQTVVCQFTWLCDGSVGRRPVQPQQYAESMEAAKKVLLEGFRLPSLKNALYYHADYVNPRWNKEQVAKIGRHIFYKPREKNDGNV